MFIYFLRCRCYSCFIGVTQQSSDQGTHKAFSYIFQGKIKIATLNVRGLNDHNKRKIIINSLNNKNADIILLQETHLTESAAKKLETEWRNKLYHSYGSSASSGVTTSINNKLNHEMLSEWSDTNGRFHILRTRIESKTFCIINIYAPNKDDPDFFNSIIEKIEENSDCDVTVLGGDFNLVIDPSKDRLKSLHNPPNASQIVRSYIEKAHMVDSWRMVNPEANEFTWSRLSTNPSASRIDMIFLPMAYANKIIESKISPCRRTDHKIVCTTLTVDEIERGPGVWKFNNKFLLDPEFTSQIRELIQENSKFQDFINPSDFWLHLKKEIISFCKKLWSVKCWIKKTA